MPSLRCEPRRPGQDAPVGEHVSPVCAGRSPRTETRPRHDLDAATGLLGVVDLGDVVGIDVELDGDLVAHLDRIEL